MTISNERIERAARADVTASHILNEFTYGIVRESELGPIEEVDSSPLQTAIASEIAAAEMRGRIEGLKGMRPASEIRAEMERWKARMRECRAARQPIEAAYAAAIVGALSYALGKTPTSAVRIKE